MAVGRERDGGAEFTGAFGVRARELAALRRPCPGRAREDPGGAHHRRFAFVVRAADQGGISVGGQGRAEAELPFAFLAAANELRPLM